MSPFLFNMNKPCSKGLPFLYTINLQCYYRHLTNFWKNWHIFWGSVVDPNIRAKLYRNLFQTWGKICQPSSELLYSVLLTLRSFQ